MNYYIVIIIILIFTLPLLTYYYILPNRQCVLSQQLLPTNNLNKNFSSNIKSQFNQDVVMYYKYFFNKVNGVFVEIGAFDGVTISNTYFFEKNFNWHGVLIEGGENNCKDLFANKKERSNSKLVCAPICKSEYTSFRDAGFYGTIDKIQTSAKRIKCNTLSNITHFYNIKHIDLFSLDVEGSELEVLQTFDFSVSVSYWLIEWNNLRKTLRDGITSLLNKNGYVLLNQYISQIDVLFVHV